MAGINGQNKIIISYRQLFFISIAQLGGASVIYLPGATEAGRDIWISNIIASIAAYIVIFTHYLPMSKCPGSSMAKILKDYWGSFLGAVINLYYSLFFFILCCLIVSDVFYFGKITMPETPGVIFIIFLLVPAVYGIKLGLETLSRLLEFLMPILILIYCMLFLFSIPKLDFMKVMPVLSEGIKPVLSGTMPNLNFPFAQILPVAFYLKYTKTDSKGPGKFIKYTFTAIFISTILLTLRALASAAAFDNYSLKTLTYPPFSTIRIVELGHFIERLDAFLLAIFYCTTFFKFILTFYLICEIISDFFNAGNPKDFALPVAILIGVSMPFLIPRFDVILNTVVPYFYISLPIFIPIPLLLYFTIKIKHRSQNKRKSSKIN